MENIDKIANIDAIANAIKNNSEDGFFFVPWIGKNYDKGLKESKVLVVGASHYCNHSNICIHPYNNKDCSNYNCLNRCNLGCDYFLDCTSENTKRYNDYCAWMKKEEYSKSYEILCNEIDEKIYDCKMIFEKFSKFCIEYFFEGKCYKEYRNQLWSHIAFVNYAQNFQPASTGNKFKKSDFEAFKKYLEVLKPDIVIVWGCALGGELEKREFKKEAKFYGYNWENEGIQFVNSYHPSYGGFEDNGGLEEALDKAFQEASKVTNG